MRSLLILALTALTSGCVIIEAQRLPFTYKHELKPASSLASSYTGALGKVVSLSKLECSASANPHNNESFHTKEELMENWGPPSKIEINGSTEKFIYKGKIRWSGAVLGSVIVIIPLYIPLIVPSGREYCSVFFTNGIISGIETVRRANSTIYRCHMYQVDGHPNYQVGCLRNNQPK